MAIIKRLPCHGQSGSSALDYVIYKHDEFTREPVLDDDGKRELRDDFYLSGINCSAQAFPVEMIQLETVWGKNLEPEDIRMYQFIISYDPKDANDYLLDGPRAQMLSMILIRRCLPGTLGIACTHLDGDHHSGNIHTHVFLSSIQYSDEISTVMHYPAAAKAGDKLSFSRSTMREIKEHLVAIVEEAKLHQINLFQIPGDRISNGEYWVQFCGQRRLDDENRKRMEAGLTVEETRFRGKKQMLREALQDAMFQSTTVEQFREILETRHQVKITESGAWWRFGFIGDGQSYASSTLGSNYYKEEINRVIESNRVHPERMEEYRAEKARRQELEKIPPKPDITTTAGCRMLFQSSTEDLLLIAAVCRLALSMEKTESQESLQEKWPQLARSVLFLQEYQVRSMVQLDPLEVMLRGNLLYYQKQTEERESILRDRINTLYYAQALEQHEIQNTMNESGRFEEARIEDIKTLQEWEDAKQYFREPGRMRPMSVKRAWGEKMDAQRIVDRYRELKQKMERDLQSLDEVRAVLEPWKDRLPSQPVPVFQVMEVIMPRHLRGQKDRLHSYLEQVSVFLANGWTENRQPSFKREDAIRQKAGEQISMPIAAGFGATPFDYIVQVEEDPVLKIAGRAESEQDLSEGSQMSDADTTGRPESGTNRREAAGSGGRGVQKHQNKPEAGNEKDRNNPDSETIRREKLNGRIRKLMDRRGSSLPDGTATGRTGGERADDTDALIRKAETGIHYADTIEEDSRTERRDKETQRKDRDNERKRQADEERTRTERKRREAFERSGSQGRGRQSIDFER